MLVSTVLYCIVLYAKPNVAKFNSSILIQFNIYLFNSVRICSIQPLHSFNFNSYLFNLILRFIQFNFYTHSIQSVFIQFNFYIHSIQSVFIQFNFYIHSIQSVFIQFNFYIHSMFAKIHSILGSGSSGKIG